MVLSIREAANKNTTRYETIEFAGDEIRIGSLSARAVTKWLAMNEDPEHKDDAGVYLLVMSLVEGAANDRAPENDWPELVKLFHEKDTKELGRAITACLKLNFLQPKAVEEAKNDSGEAPTDASPSN